MHSIFCNERFSYIWYKHSDICSRKLYWQYLWDLDGLLVWYLKRGHGFNSQPRLVLSTVNSFQLMIFKIFNQSSIYIFAPINFLTENQIRKYVQLCCLGSGTFLQFFHFMLIWSFEENILFTLYLQSCKETVDVRLM